MLLNAFPPCQHRRKSNGLYCSLLKRTVDVCVVMVLKSLVTFPIVETHPAVGRKAQGVFPFSFP